MSIESWKAEFYPVEASEVPKEQAVAHSLKKWEGLRIHNLQRHGMFKDGYTFLRNLNERGKFYVNADTCALCKYHLDNSCPNCPLSQVRGDCPCDTDRGGESCSPYDMWTQHNNPEPMIDWLEKAKAYEESKT